MSRIRFAGRIRGYIKVAISKVKGFNAEAQRREDAEGILQV
jgi:hypothetical protein